MKKITMMDNLTMFINKNEYKVEIGEKFTKVSSLDDIEDLEHSIPGFFDLESISRQDDKIYLIYDLPEGYQTLEKAKKYVPVIKLELIKNLLEIDPLLEVDGMTYLDLNNVFFKSFNDVKVLYRSNGHLPYHQLDILEQYKLFIMGFFSDKYSYKRFVVNKDNLLKKENNEFLFSVNAALSFAELKTLIDQELKKEQSKFYEKVQFDHKRNKKGFKRKIYFSVLSTLAIILVFVGGMKQVEKNVAANFQQEIAASKLENELTFALASGDTKQAKKLMEEKGEGSVEIAKMLIDAGKYNEAIDYDKGVEKDVVNRLYEIGQKEKILELESDSDFITLEKEIVEFEEETLLSKISLVTEKDTLKRMGLAFMENKNYQMALDILQRLNGEEFDLKEKEKKLVDQYIKKAKLEIEIDVLNEQIMNLKNTDSFNESEADKNKKDKEIKELEEKLVELQKDLIKHDEKLGTDA
ncbi:type VII secretion protein EssB/YukC [Pontibacillus litoralis]|uniref:Type VII secretion protein EssB n=1 Tax=Pontibacillus litoralis JSM 072002 TaxID=1385512 RepID=A0A0A5G273_9BACI|nr:type VII secretion protein EssB/YukC [Pontibacillus litoralis]KGX85180.1 hypothetical protein N784_09800 [Pontibacillus litoralis JSM 072002]